MSTGGNKRERNLPYHHYRSICHVFMTGWRWAGRCCITPQFPTAVTIGEDGFVSLCFPVLARAGTLSLSDLHVNVEEAIHCQRLPEQTKLELRSRGGVSSRAELCLEFTLKGFCKESAHFFLPWLMTFPCPFQAQRKNLIFSMQWREDGESARVEETLLLCVLILIRHQLSN